MRTSKFQILLLTFLLATSVVLTTGCEDDGDPGSQTWQQIAAEQLSRADALSEDLAVATPVAFVSVVVTLTCIALLLRERSTSKERCQSSNRKENTDDRIK